MSKIVIGSYQEFEAYVGKELGVSDYLKLNNRGSTSLHRQPSITSGFTPMLNGLEKESPFKKTIAHGYLAVSLVPYMWNQIATINNVKMLINYGIEKLKFNQPILVDSEVRLRVKLASLINLRGIAKVELDAILEIKDNPKPAFTATVILLYHFN
jgi:Acyl dehydratase